MLWKVLIAEDIKENGILLKAILKERAECEIAVNGNQAIDAVFAAAEAGEPFDMVLLDIAMPELDGVSALEQIRKKEEEDRVPFGETVPIIMVTALKQQIFTAFNKGCDGYLVKPILKDVVISKIEEVLEERDNIKKQA